jgi:hypothetical protein
VRSNGIVNLFGKRINLAEEHTHQYVTSIIHVRAKQVTIVTVSGEIVHQGDFALSRNLR